MRCPELTDYILNGMERGFSGLGWMYRRPESEGGPCCCHVAESSHVGSG